MNQKKFFSYKWFVHIFFVLYALACILPFLLIVSISLTAEDYVVNEGFSLFIRDFSTNAYTHIFQNPQSIIDAYAVTAFFSLVGTLLSISFMSMIGYALSRDGFAFKKPINIVLWCFFSSAAGDRYSESTKN